MTNERVKERLASEETVYVSITGLRLKRPWHFFRFLWLAVPSKLQADKAAGNLMVALKDADGVRHTLTVWETRSDMMAFVHSGAHLRAIKGFRAIATGKTLGYEADRVPDWEEAIAMWEEEGVVY